VAMIVPPFIIAPFDWRYELPQFSLIPIAAVLGLTALAGWDRASEATVLPAVERDRDRGADHVPGGADQPLLGSAGGVEPQQRDAAGAAGRSLDQ